MGKNLLQSETLRYHRAYSFTVDALHTLSCSPGGMRGRLQKIDLEFFTLSTNELPEIGELREKFKILHDLATSKEVRYSHESRISATLDQLHHTKLKSIAKLIWDIHTEFSAFMQSGDSLSC
ncbi:MAG: hypothetical protein WAV95_18870 [Azonexus sp.]